MNKSNGKLKVYGVGWCGKYRRIVAASNLKTAAELIKTTVHQMQRYACITGNDQEVKLAMSEPGVVWERTNDHKEPADWRKVS